MSLPAIECIRRGAYNARANWELVLAHWVGVMATAVLTVAGVLPFVLVIGLAGFAGFTGLRNPEQAAEWLQDWATRTLGELFTFSMPMVLALVAALALGTLAMVVYCFFQGGLYGILAAGDRQAPAGPPGDWRLFRTWSTENFRGWGVRHVWRFFWFFNLALVLLTVLLAGFLLFLGFVAVGGQSWGPAAAFAVGCGSVVPLFLLVLLFALWVLAGQATLASEDTTLRGASRRALRIVGRRFGGLLLILLCGVVASVVLAMVFMPFSLIISLATRDALVAGLALRGLLLIVEWGVGGVVQVAVAGSLVALVRSELKELPA